MRDRDRPLFTHDVLACCAATLIVYVGVVHEVVGSRLYPYGPAMFGGAWGWHATGCAGIASGLLLVRGALRWRSATVVALAATVGAIGALVFVATAIRHADFHLFALTLVVAACVLVLATRSRSLQ